MKSLTILKFIVVFTEFVTMFFAFGAIVFFCEGYPLSVVLNYMIGTMMSGLCLTVSVCAGLAEEKEDSKNDPIEAEAQRVERLQQERERHYRHVAGLSRQPGGVNYNTGTGDWYTNSIQSLQSLGRQHRRSRNLSYQNIYESLENRIESYSSLPSTSLLERSVNEYEREQERIREFVRLQQITTAPRIFITATRNRDRPSAGGESLSNADIEQSFRISMDISNMTMTEDKPAGQPKAKKVEEKPEPEVIAPKVVTSAISSLQINE